MVESNSSRVWNHGDHNLGGLLGLLLHWTQFWSPAGLIFVSEEMAITMAESLEDEFRVIGDDERDDEQDGEAL